MKEKQGSTAGENNFPPRFPIESRDIKGGIIKIMAQSQEEEKMNEKLQYKIEVQELLCQIINGSSFPTFTPPIMSH